MYYYILHVHNNGNNNITIIFCTCTAVQVAYWHMYMCTFVAIIVSSFMSLSTESSKCSAIPWTSQVWDVIYLPLHNFNFEYTIVILFWTSLITGHIIMKNNFFSHNLCVWFLVLKLWRWHNNFLMFNKKDILTAKTHQSLVTWLCVHTYTYTVYVLVADWNLYCTCILVITTYMYLIALLVV